MCPEPIKYHHLSALMFALSWMCVCYILQHVIPRLRCDPAPWWLPFVLAMASVAGSAYNVGVVASMFQRNVNTRNALQYRGGAIALYFLTITYLYSEFVRVLESS